VSDFETVCVTTVDAAWAALRNRHFDLVLLDIELETKDGYVLLTDMQNTPEFREIPIMCISGRGNLTDKVTAFSLGADDYIVKPFDPIELKARVSSKVHRYQRRVETKNLRVGPIEIDHARHTVTLETPTGLREIEITQTEFKLLNHLAKRPEQVYTRDQLLVAAWGEKADVLERVVDVHLCSLRRKLAPFSHYVKAVPGIGYKFSVQPAPRKSV
jgi:DNA-binding response OmpR family regulator